MPAQTSSLPPGGLEYEKTSMSGSRIIGLSLLMCIFRLESQEKTKERNPCLSTATLFMTNKQCGELPESLGDMWFYTMNWKSDRFAALSMLQLHSGGWKLPSPRNVSLEVDRRKRWETIAGDAHHAAGPWRHTGALQTRTEARSFQVHASTWSKTQGRNLANDDGGLLRSKHVETVKISTAARHGDARMLQLGNILDLSTRRCGQDTAAHAKAARCGTRQDRE